MIDLTPLAITHSLAKPGDFAIILPHLQLGTIQILGHEPPDSEGWVFVRPSEIPDGMEACCAHLCQELESQVNALPSLAKFSQHRDNILHAASVHVNLLRSERRIADPAGKAMRHMQHLTNLLQIPNETAIQSRAHGVRRQAIQAIANLVLLLEVQPEWGAREAFQRSVHASEREAPCLTFCCLPSMKAAGSD